MLNGIIKYSDERNRRFSIKTTVVDNSEDAYVVKESVFPEGTEHIKTMYENQEKLGRYYANVKTCKGSLVNDNAIRFDFVQGASLEKKYISAVHNQDKDEYERLLQEHKKIIMGVDDNQCDFLSNDEFEKIFGNGQSYEGRAGLKFSNFDAIPSNIIFDNGLPTFIDYEWVMDFVMPLELVIYNCIDNLYLKNKQVEEFYPRDKALEYLGVYIEQDILKASYAEFFNYIIKDEDGRSYANDKITCLKPLDTIQGIREEWENCAEKWKSTSAMLEEREKELNEVRREWQKCADEWRNSVAVIREKEEEILEIRGEWQKCADEWRNAVTIVEEKDKAILEVRQACENAVAVIETKDRELLELREKYNAIINSKTWKLATAIKKPLRMVKKQ